MKLKDEQLCKHFKVKLQLKDLINNRSDYDSKIIKEVDQMRRKSFSFNHYHKKNKYVDGYIGFSEEMLAAMEM